MMLRARALVANRVGAPDVLEIVEVDVPDPGPGEVTIEVRTAGVNPVDAAGFAGGSPELPVRPGRELAGVVTAIGPDAEGPVGAIRVGDEVIAYPVKGGYAERITVPASSVLPKPAALSWAQAANLMLVGVTATHLLEATGVGPGDRVLIHGASGGVGLTAAQLAILRGAHVVGTASERNQQLLRDHGITAIRYGDGLVDRVRAVWPAGPTVALDAVGTDEAIDTSIELVADRDRIATIAGFRRGAEVGIRMLGGGPGADPGRDIRTAARAEVARLADEGKLDVIVSHTFALDEAAQALALVKTGHPGGQVALVAKAGLS